MTHKKRIATVTSGVLLFCVVAAFVAVSIPYPYDNVGAVTSANIQRSGHTNQYPVGAYLLVDFTNNILGLFLKQCRFCSFMWLEVGHWNERTAPPPGVCSADPTVPGCPTPGGTCSAQGATLVMSLSAANTQAAQGCSSVLTRTELVEGEDTVFVKEEWVVIGGQIARGAPASPVGMYYGSLIKASPVGMLNSSSVQFAHTKTECLLNGAMSTLVPRDFNEDVLLVIDYAPHPPNNRFMPHPSVKFTPTAVPLAGANVVSGFARLDVAKTQDIRAVDILYADGPLPANLANAIKAGVDIDYVDDRRHRFFVYGHFRIENGTLRLVNQAITLPQCCGPPQDLK